MARKLPSRKGDKVAIDVDAGSSSSPAPLDVAARFDVRDLLGEGGMGSVFAAQDRGLGRVVALKRLREGLEKDAGALRRFVLEAQIGAQLEHPNIVPLYSFERGASGSPAIAMQLLEGMTMDDYIQTAAAAPASARTLRGQYSLKERISTLLGVGEAIHFAHERGVIHRDLKPHNVMLGRYHEVYVMDWGLARVIGSPIDMARERQSTDSSVHAAAAEEPDKEKLGMLPTMVSTDGPQTTSSGSMATRQGEVMGTAQYMPPEQALGLIDQLGPSADQYSLGVILQELATLVPARSHTNAMLAFSQALKSELAEPNDLDGNHLHPALLAIIERATQREPEQRYPSVHDLTEDLRRFIRDEPVSVYREGIARRLVRAAARRPGLTFAILSFCGFTASAAIVGGVIHDARKTERQTRQLENVRRVIVAISSRAHEVEVELGGLAAHVLSVRAATVELLARQAADFENEPRALPPVVATEAYGGAHVGFTGVVVTWQDTAPNGEMPTKAARLYHLEPWLRDGVVKSLPTEFWHAPDATQNTALQAGRGALLRCFVALDDGSFVQFPARGDLTRVDPRNRPWYRMAAENNELHWTRPVADATKRTLRVSALVGIRKLGVLAGVAGCDLRVAWLAKKLAVKLQGFRRAYLVAEDGKIVVSETLEAEVLPKVKNRDDDLALPPVDDPELARRIAGPDRGGYVRSGKRLFVFSKLISPAWTYVAELDPSHYFED